MQYRELDSNDETVGQVRRMSLDGNTVKTEDPDGSSVFTAKPKSLLNGLKKRGARGHHPNVNATTLSRAFLSTPTCQWFSSRALDNNSAVSRRHHRYLKE